MLVSVAPASPRGSAMEQVGEFLSPPIHEPLWQAACDKPLAARGLGSQRWRAELPVGVSVATSASRFGAPRPMLACTSGEPKPRTHPAYARGPSEGRHASSLMNLSKLEKSHAVLARREQAQSVNLPYTAFARASRKRAALVPGLRFVGRRVSRWAFVKSAPSSVSVRADRR